MAALAQEAVRRRGGGGQDHSLRAPPERQTGGSLGTNGGGAATGPGGGPGGGQGWRTALQRSGHVGAPADESPSPDIKAGTRFSFPARRRRPGTFDGDYIG